MGRSPEAGGERIASTRNALGLVSDVGGAAAAASMLAALGIGAGGAVAGLLSDEPSAVSLGIVLVCGVVLGAACTYVILARRASSLEVQRGYRWVRATYTYRVDASDARSHEQTAEIVIRAVRHGVRMFSNQYRWSGIGGEGRPTVLSPGHSLAGPVRQKLAWRLYDVEIVPALHKGQSTTVSVLQSFHDAGKQFESFLAKTVIEPIEHLTLRVELPAGLVPERAWRVTRRGSGPQAHELSRVPVPETEFIPRPRTGDPTKVTLEWHVARPTVGRSYALDWTYAHGDDMYGHPAASVPATDADLVAGTDSQALQRRGQAHDDGGGNLVI